MLFTGILYIFEFKLCCVRLSRVKYPTLPENKYVRQIKIHRIFILHIFGLDSYAEDFQQKMIFL